MMDDTTDRRTLVTLLGGLAVAAGAATAAGAQTPPVAAAPGSTWDQIVKRGTLRLGATNNEPWYLKDLSAAAGTADAWKGIGPALGRAIADAMNVKLDIVETSWSGAVAALQSNQFDLMFMLDGTPGRAMAIDFVPAPVLWYPTSLLVRDGIEGETWSDFDKEEYTLGATTGATTTAYALQFFKKAKITQYPKTDDTLASFQAGRSDMTVGTAPSSDAIAFKLKRGKSIVPRPYQWFAGGTGLRLEESRRFKDFVTTCCIYFYNSGFSQKAYEDYLTLRGMDVAKVSPIMRELYKS